MMSVEIIHVITTSAICFIFILLRTAYRLLYRCRVHTNCHRKWHVDDLWMAFSILPLVGRALCIAWSNSLLGQDAGVSAAEKQSAKMLSNKLLIPGRVFYVLFLWCMKMCLLELYLRISEGLPLYRNIGLGIRWSLYITFVAVVLATLLECRPLQLVWNGDPAGVHCRKARANLITMAVCNIATDFALILFPISLLRRSGLDFMRFLRLAVLFALGSLVILTTIIRLPLILQDDAQKTRSLWASIEIACACFIANAPFFQAVVIDMSLGGQHNTSLAFLQRTPSQATRTQSNSTKLDDEDEIGLWHIERRISFSVSRTSNSAGSEETDRRTEPRYGDESTYTKGVSLDSIRRS